MIASEKSHQNLSNYNQFFIQNSFEVDKKQIVASEKMRIVFMIMLTRSSVRIFNSMRYTGEFFFRMMGILYLPTWHLSYMCICMGRSGITLLNYTYYRDYTDTT